MKPEISFDDFPEPNELKVSKADRTMAKGHMENLDSCLIWYVRDEKPEVAKIDKRYKMVRSAPKGAVIAFKDSKQKVHIGWSRRHSGKIKNEKGEVIKNVEEVPFTKKRALYTAFLRGILDSIVMNPVSKSAKAGSGVILPKDVAALLPRFINYASNRKKMQGDVANLVIKQKYIPQTP